MFQGNVTEIFPKQVYHWTQRSYSLANPSYLETKFSACWQHGCRKGFVQGVVDF